MDLQEVRWEGKGWIDQADDTEKWWALVNSVMKVRLKYNLGNLLTS